MFNGLVHADFVRDIFMQEHAHYFAVRGAHLLADYDPERRYFAHFPGPQGGAVVGHRNAINAFAPAGVYQLLIRHVGISRVLGMDVQVGLDQGLTDPF
jgi:hypothetical protein